MVATVAMLPSVRVRVLVLVLVLTVLVMIESVGSFAWFLYWFGKTVPGKPSEVVAQAQPVPAAMKLVLAILVFMSFCSSIMAVYWLNHGG